MSTLIQNAATGQRKAMEQLYEAAKRKAYFIATSLLHSQNDAEDACIWAFRNIWYELGEIQTEEEFVDLAVRRTVRYCKKQVLRKNPKAYNMPFGRNFQITGMPTLSKKSGDDVESILAQFTPLQRLIFVLDTAADYDEERIAKTVDMDRKAVDTALTAQVSNIDRLIGAMGKTGELTYETVLSAYIARESSVVIPDKMETQITEMIDRIATPIEKKAKQKKIGLSVLIGAVLCVLIAVFAVILINDSEEYVYDDSPSTSTATDTTDATDVTDATEDSVETTDNTIDTSEETETTEEDVPTTGDGATLEEAVATHYATIEILNYGTIQLELYGNSAPQTVENFVSLAESGFYGGLTFHRIIEGFMIQGGDPNGNGTGGAEEEIFGEFSSNGFENNLSHIRGVISMARSNAFDSASSQFFIVHQDSIDSLDGKYAAFGYVTEGMDVVDAICAEAEPIDSNGSIDMEMQPIITSITITYAE